MGRMFPKFARSTAFYVGASGRSDCTMMGRCLNDRRQCIGDLEGWLDRTQSAHLNGARSNNCKMYTYFGRLIAMAFIASKSTTNFQAIEHFRETPRNSGRKYIYFSRNGDLR